MGAGISASVVIWETITGLEKRAMPFERWKGRVENFDTVVDIYYRKSRKEVEDGEKNGGEDRVGVE